MINSQPWSQGFLPVFDEDYLSQGDRGKYLLKMAATKVMEFPEEETWPEISKSPKTSEKEKWRIPSP